MPPLEVGSASVWSLEPAALHPAAAPVHRGVAREGAGGEGHRAAVDVRPDPDDHPEARVRPEGPGVALAHRPRRDGDLLVKAFPHIFEVAFTRRWRSRSTRSRRATASGSRRSASSSRSRRTSSRHHDGGLQGRQAHRRDLSPVRRGEAPGEVGPLRPVLRVRAVPGLQVHAEPRGQRPGGARAGRRDLRQVRPAHGLQAEPLRPLHRLLGLSRVQEHQEDHARHSVPPGGLHGELVENRSKRGRAYFGCSNFPDCRFVVWQRPVATPCPKCGMPFLTQRGGRGKRGCVRREGCDYRRDRSA